jgi:predicted deacylase
MKVKSSRQEPITVGSTLVQAGHRETIRLPVAQQLAGGETSIPVVVIHGKTAGPRLFVSAAVHGDEINGVEIIRRLLGKPVMKRIRGTLIAVPVVNVFGFVNQSRYLPDRRDLNRSFPGSPRGSMASRLADVFMREVVGRCTHGIDLHTGAIHRSNLPQIRTSIDNEQCAALGRAFGVPVIIDSATRDGSLRQAASDVGIPTLLYEAGEALRFDEVAIRGGVRGVLSVMRSLEMIPSTRVSRAVVEPLLARSTSWIRASKGGILRTTVPLGGRVREGETLGWISDPMGDEDVPVQSNDSGIVIGRTELPLVNEGDALFHIASMARPKEAERRLQSFQSELEPGDDSVPGDDDTIR